MKWSLWALLLLFPLFSQAAGPLCMDLFTTPKLKEFSTPLETLQKGQDGAGYEYALFKVLREAGLNVRTRFSALTAMQKTRMINVLRETLQEAIPVVIDPRGYIFALDGHHDLLMAVRLKMDPSTLVKVQIVDDYRNGRTMEQFKWAAEKNKWFYTKNLNDLIDNPQRIEALENDASRSQTGLVFIHISEKYNVPMKGKHFSLAVQFWLAEFLVRNELYTFKTRFTEADVEKLAALLLTNQIALGFLREALKDNAHENLRNFLDSL